jgi:hypothetical protein
MSFTGLVPAGWYEPAEWREVVEARKRTVDSGRTAVEEAREEIRRRGQFVPRVEDPEPVLVRF